MTPSGIDERVRFTTPCSRAPLSVRGQPSCSADLQVRDTASPAYSVRTATGSTRVARSDGATHATSATQPLTNATVEKNERVCRLNAEQLALETAPERDRPREAEYQSDGRSKTRPSLNTS